MELPRKISQDCFLKAFYFEKFNLKKSFKSSTKNSQLPMQIHVFLTFAILGLMFLSVHTRLFMSRVRVSDVMSNSTSR